MAVILNADYDMQASGSGQYLNVSFTGPNLRASHTIAVRVKHTDAATNYNALQCYYLSQSDITGSAIARVSGTTSTGMSWMRQAAFFSYTQDTAVRSTCFGNTSTWYHICFVYNASTGQIRSYIDGTFIAQHASSTTRPSSSTANAFGIAGSVKMADAAFYDRALDDAEVASLAAYREPQVTSGLSVFWRLDSNATDSSGNGRNGSVVGSGTAPTYSTADNPPQPEVPLTDIAGNSTTASTLSGTAHTRKAVAGSSTTASTLSGALSVSAGAVAVAGNSSSSSQLQAFLRPRWGRRYTNTRESWSGTGPSFSQPWTYAVWVRNVAGSSSIDFALRAQGGGEYALLGLFSGNFYLDASSIADGSFFDISVAIDAGWHHLAMTYTGTNVLGYVDGVEVLNEVMTFAGAPTSIYTESQSAGSRTFDAASAKVWSTSLTQPEIISESQYHAPHYKTGSTLFAWWPMEWTAPLADRSGNGRNRTVADGAGGAEVGSESPEQMGSPLTDVAGNSTSASTLTGTALVRNVLAGPAVSASTFAGTARVANALVGSSSSSSALSASLAVAIVLNAAAGSSSALSGALDNFAYIAGDSASASALAGTLAVARPIAGTSTSASSLSGTTRLAKALSASSVSSSTLSGALALDSDLAGSSTSASGLNATLGVLRLTAGDATSSSSFVGTLGQDLLVLGDASSTSTLSGALNLDVLIAGDSTSSSALTATLAVARPIAGGSTSASTLAGIVGITGEFVGPASSASTFAGTLGVLRLAAGGATSASTLSGTTRVANALVGTAASASTLNGSITAGSESGVSGDASSASSLAGSLDVALAVAGASASASTLGGTLAVGNGLAGAPTNASTLAGTAHTIKNLSSTVAGSSSTLSGALSVVRTVFGNSTSASTLSGSLSFVRNLSGDGASASALSAALSVAGVRPVEGAATSGSTLSGALTGGIGVAGGGGGGNDIRRMGAALGTARRRIR